VSWITGNSLLRGSVDCAAYRGLYAQPWGFQLQDITGEVELWHGEQDHNVPVSVGRYVGGALPNCEASFIENEGHLTLISNYVRNVLEGLTA
jgi:pimeloyl-ACP methyl ester carboxylesterase